MLDVGAGTGLVALPAAQLVGETGSVLSVDLSAAMLDKVPAPPPPCRRVPGAALCFSWDAWEGRPSLLCLQRALVI